VSSDTVRAGTERVDFPESTVYMRSRTELGVRINKAGRDPDGVVSPSEFTSVRADVVSALREARSPDGSRLFDEVAPAEEYFHGPYVDEAVDVVAVPAGFENFLSASLNGDVFADPPEQWNHKLHGVLALAGDAVDADADLADPHLFDVAPSVLATLGVPPSERMDGDQLSPVEPVSPEQYAPFTASLAAADDDDAVTRRLSNLGYIEDDEH
jgi:predicted AlkP superfamily phosphohydrolase/phosphomutase